MRWVSGLLGLVLIMFLGIPIGIITMGSLAVAPAVAEQLRLDPCAAYDTRNPSAGTTSPQSVPLPRWGTPRHQSLTSPAHTIPAPIKALYVAAGRKVKVPWVLLAGIGMAETRHGRTIATSSAGAQGLMQFLPGTFASYGVDGDGDGRKDIHNDADSIHSAANYLARSGVRDGARGVIGALWAYNRSISYRNDVLYYAWSYAGNGGAVVSGANPADCVPVDGELPGVIGSCPPSGSAAEYGLKASAKRGLRCVKQAFPAITRMGGKGGRPISTSDHPKGLAVDFMIPTWNRQAGNAFGWRVARWIQTHAKGLRVRYIIWDAKKWNPSAGRSWRPYRHPLGSSNPTLAHRDHVHVSFHSS